MNQLNSISATNLARMIRDREISPVEIVGAYLDRIEQLNPSINALVTLAPDAIEKAQEAEQAVKRLDSLPSLHGVPVTIKDTIATKGLRTTSGSPMRSQFVPELDSSAVARLRSAGAIILGKTNTAEMAMDYTADNPVFGRTNNPHDVAYSPGGSSGGEAAAIAAGMSVCGLGSDLAGSIRIPAHFCGIAGFKPATASVPGDGQCPPSSGPYSLGSAIGPMARCVEDLGLLFNVLAGTTTSFETTRLGGTRVAWYADDGSAPVTTETLAAVEKAAQVLADAGMNVRESRPPGVEHGYDLWLKLFSRASVVQLRETYAGHEEEGGEFVRWRLRTADDTPPPTLDDYILAWKERDRLRATLLSWIKEVPLIIAPVGSTPAVKHDTLKIRIGDQNVGMFRAFSYSQTYNVFDLPALSIPVGRSPEGMPVGVQIISLPSQEDLILAAARIIEQGV
jgi:Asp-tRNA(Asn)/Glu-tRNA(Gln) amidotransferase A subunit family amidase